MLALLEMEQSLDYLPHARRQKDICLESKPSSKIATIRPKPGVKEFP